MSQPAAGGATRAETLSPDPEDASTGELVGSLTEQIGRLVRDEVRLAQAAPPLPTETIAGVRPGVGAVTQAGSR